VYKEAIRQACDQDSYDYLDGKADKARLDLVIISTAVRGTEYIDQDKVG
jgi:hypothetical protein